MVELDPRGLRPWLISGGLWLGASVAIVKEYLRTQSPEYLYQILFLLSLLWCQFGFAGLFASIRKQAFHRIPGLLLAIVIPPLVLYFIAFTLVMRG